MLSQLVTQFNEPVRAVESIDPAADTDEFAAVTETKIAYVFFFPNGSIFHLVWSFHGHLNCDYSCPWLGGPSTRDLNRATTVPAPSSTTTKGAARPVPARPAAVPGAPSAVSGNASVAGTAAAAASSGSARPLPPPPPGNLTRAVTAPSPQPNVSAAAVVPASAPATGGAATVAASSSFAALHHAHTAAQPSSGRSAATPAPGASPLSASSSSLSTNTNAAASANPSLSSRTASYRPLPLAPPASVLSVTSAGGRQHAGPFPIHGVTWDMSPEDWTLVRAWH